MERALRLALRRRSYWMAKNPEEGRKYVYLKKDERAKVDALFEAGGVKPVKVNTLVDKLDEKRRERNRVSSWRTKALASMHRLEVMPKYRDSTVDKNVAKHMSPGQLKTAATSSVDELKDYASVQYEGNPFYYH